MCAKICSDNTDDLWQETLLILLEYNEEKIINLHTTGKLKFFVCKIMMNQSHSNSSAFHKKYRKQDFFYKSDIDNEEYDYEQDVLINKCVSEMSLYASSNDNNWYRNELFKLYIEQGSMRELSKNTGIPVMSIHRSINEFKNDIKQRLNENTTSSTISASQRYKLLQAIDASRLSENT